LVLSVFKKGGCQFGAYLFVRRLGNYKSWLGGMDDLWSFRKPMGDRVTVERNLVKANELSDLYFNDGMIRKPKLHADKDVK